jgi:hypothetical protein
MSSSTAQRWALWLCLAGYVLASGCGFHGLVLCFGPRGHVAIEMSSAGDCDGCVAEQPGGDAGQADDQAAPECPCEDVALPGANLLARKFDLDSAAIRIPPAAACVLVWSCAVEPRVRLEARDAASHFASANRMALTRPRSAVLLV